MALSPPDIPEGLDEALSLIRTAMSQAAKQRVRPDVAVWALFLEAVGRLTELHSPQAAAEFLASLQAELRQAGAAAERSWRN